MKKIILTLILGMFLISFASAQSSLGTFEQGSSINLQQVCDNCTYVNLTKIVYPNSSYALLGQFSMTKNGTNFNYTLIDTNTLGIYYYTTCGNLNGIVTCNNVDFEVTPSGRVAPTSGEGMIYLASIGAMVLITLFFFCLSFTIKPESALRFIFIALSFVMAIITVLYAFVSLNETLAGFTSMVKYFGTFYFVLLMVLFVIFILVLLAITFKALEMLKLKKGLKAED